MFRTFFLCWVVVVLAGCATVDSSSDSSRPAVELTRFKQEDARAKHYLSVLWAKKNRFEQSHPELFAVEEEEAIGAVRDSMALSECRKIDAGRWADSVRYGQDFLSYENYVVAMERCLNSQG